ncbi:MAG TPA: hypothetical protein VFH27_13060 [Longimicrobiaceae bacterium]|nr:hypothetical protein [Longimicrobiaceae bacterium]
MSAPGNGSVLHVTNGDAAVAALRAGGITGPMLPWRDVLHDGPVPAGLTLPQLSDVRARFIAGEGWGAVEEVAAGFRERDATLSAFDRHSEVVLWFEHDLYDQLQLIQALDFLHAQPAAAGTRLSLVNPAEYLGMAAPDRIAQLFRERRPVTAAQLAAGAAAWAAFRSPDPRAIEAAIEGDAGDLPHLAAALRRHTRQFPSVRNGLSLSEQYALEAIDAGATVVKDAYVAAHHHREDPFWMGDSTFVAQLVDLAGGPHPLVAWADGTPITQADDNADVISRAVALTDAGRDVMHGRADRVRLNGIDRWLGGVHLDGDHARWRWDEAAGRITGPLTPPT